MYSASDLRKEIKEVIDDTIGLGKRVKAAWIATEICNRHQEISGEDTEFWKFTGISDVHSEVRKFISSIKSDEEDEEKQGALPFTMPGYRYLQKFYFVADPTNPDDGNVGIPITEMSGEQIEAKAQEYERMAAGCVAHANELRRYSRNRRNIA